MIHLPLLVGQLTRAVARSLVHHRRRHDFGVAGGICLIEEELDESTLHAGTLADVNRETGAGDFHTKVEINQVILLGKFPVRHLSLVVNSIVLPFSHRSHLIAKVALHHQVVAGSSALRHQVVWHVWYGEQDIAYFVLGSLQLFVDLSVVLLNLSHLSLSGLSFILFALLHQCTNLCSKFVELGSLTVASSLSSTALLVESNNAADWLTGIEMFFCQLGYHTFGVGINYL